MPNFKFQLQSLLSVRKQEHASRQVMLAQTLAAQRLIEARRDATEDELRRQQRRTRARAAPGRLDVASLATEQQYEASLRAELAALAQEADACQREVDARREAVLEANRDLRALEKLRERQHERHLSDEARAQAIELDEVAARNANRQSIV
jgi:flagellar export protein FliJ